MFVAPLFTALVALFSGVNAQYNAKVGPTTDLSFKTNICNVLDYGAVANNTTDIGVAIASGEYVVIQRIFSVLTAK
jgi:rhamnogalacturonan hydrolase